MATSPASTLTTPRDDLGLFFEEISLDAVQQSYIGFQLAPVIESPMRFGNYSYRKLEQILPKNDGIAQTEGGGFKRSGNEFSTKPFNIETGGREEPVPHSQQATYIGMINAELIAAQTTRHMCLEWHELEIMEEIDGLPSTPIAGAEQWQLPTANPVEYFTKARQRFRLRVGVAPNALTMDEAAVDVLAKNPFVLDAAGGNASGVKELEDLNGNRETKKRIVGTALGFQQIIESGGIKNTVGAPLAAQLETTMSIDTAIMSVVNSGVNTRIPQWIRTAHWSANGSRAGTVFEQYEEPQTDSTVIRHRLDHSILTVNDKAVEVLKGVLDPTYFD